MSLETKNYVATTADVEAIARAMLDARATNVSGQATYFRALLATTQHELGAAPRQRTVASEKISRETRDQQVAALKKVHVRFSEAITKAAREKFPKASGVEINKYVNFARTAKSTLQAWIRARNDITCLAAARTTKYALVTELARTRRKPTSPKVLTNRTQRYADRFTQTALALAGSDQEAARAAIEKVRDQLNAALARLSTSGVRRLTARGGNGRHRMQAAA